LGYYNLVVDSSSLPLLKPVDTDFIHFRKLSEPLVKTPLYQQAFDWLFKEFNVYLQISNNLSYEDKVKILQNAIRDIQNNKP
jgi:hypothetical protein